MGLSRSVRNVFLLIVCAISLPGVAHAKLKVASCDVWPKAPTSVEPITLSVVIVNDGPGAATIPGHVHLWTGKLNSNIVFDGMGGEMPATLQPGQKINAPNLNPAFQLPAGDYPVTVTFDPDQMIGAPGPRPSVTCNLQVTQGQAQVTLSSAFFDPRTGDASRIYKANAIIKNARQAKPLYYYGAPIVKCVGKNPALDGTFTISQGLFLVAPGKEELIQTELSHLPPRAYSWTCAALTPDGSAPVETKTVTALLDVAPAHGESGLPDFAWKPCTVSPLHPTVNDQINITSSVQNVGSASANFQPLVSQYLVSVPGYSKALKANLPYAFYPREQTEAALVIKPGQLKSGNYIATFVADPQNTISVGKPQNKSMRCSFSVLPVGRRD